MPVVKEPEAPTESADVGPNYSPVLVDVPPKTLKTVTPIYPAIAKSRRVKGMVLVNALVGSNGKVIQALTLRGELTLRQAAVNCVEKWEFTPAIRDGKPVKCWKAVTVSFQR